MLRRIFGPKRVNVEMTGQKASEQCLMRSSINCTSLQTLLGVLKQGV
jgi:hypothetical protein